ncbi:dipeptidase PepE [Hanstruepera neustonica]|uniref:Dipeptidase PepE n=1 Tax=Hanstruepera neustonica TaxID=1445657 RepID=A0A2K1E4V4_9FLAO|nr:dipeptidase PepE [Hanstruepera neustonica]PNQ75308.1 dipeptidase PepE [Hanstruepera neustonica]
MKKLILASTSTIYGSGYLEYLMEELAVFFADCSTITFIPYARPSGISHNEYTEKVRKAFNELGKKTIGLHEFESPMEAIRNAEALFTGGGNTFVLINQLYKFDLIQPLKEVVESGIPYLGTSAGSNICGLTINTTNDMPIVYPPSFKALSIVPFNINPHYLDPILNNKHMGETRETRINEFHHFNTQPVVGLREGNWIEVIDGNIRLKGQNQTRIFEYNKEPYEVESGSSINNLN